MSWIHRIHLEFRMIYFIDFVPNLLFMPFLFPSILGITNSYLCQLQQKWFCPHSLNNKLAILSCNILCLISRKVYVIPHFSRWFSRNTLFSFLFLEISWRLDKILRIYFLCPGRMILETDGSIIAGKVATNNMDDGASLSEQVLIPSPCRHESYS